MYDHLGVKGLTSHNVFAVKNSNYSTCLGQLQDELLCIVFVDVGTRKCLEV